MTLSSILRHNWPADRPEPKVEEMEVAKVRYRADIAKYPNDTSDWCFGLEFAMATYHPLMWLGFFFPDEAETMRLKFAAEVDAILGGKPITDAVNN